LIILESLVQHGSGRERWALPLLAAALLLAGPLHGQQFATDAAALVEYRACHLEAWHGERETRIEPACQLVRRLEVTLGIGSAGRECLVEGEYQLRTRTCCCRWPAIGSGWTPGLAWTPRPFG
jgi:hypothetical protein